MNRMGIPYEPVREEMNETARGLCLTMKGIALVKLVEAGVIRREADGSVDTDGFETFWNGFERNLYTAMDNAMEELSARYQRAEKADRAADRGRRKRNFQGKKLILPALALGLGFFLALLLVGR